MTTWRSWGMAMALAIGTPAVMAQGVIQSITSSQQAGAEVVRIELSEALPAVPSGFSVQAPPRIAIDLPGVAKDDVKITIDGRRVDVSAQTQREDTKKEGERVIYRERSSQSFARSFTLPEEVDQDASQAKLDNGVLSLALAKKRAAAARHLTIN